MAAIRSAIAWLQAVRKDTDPDVPEPVGALEGVPPVTVDVTRIDFDDCGSGPRFCDLAVDLWEMRDRPDHPAFRDALLAGCLARRDVDVRYLDDCIVLRQVAFDPWYTGTAQVNTAFSEGHDSTEATGALALHDLVDAP